MYSSYKCEKCDKRFYEKKLYESHLDVKNCKKNLPTIENVLLEIKDLKKNISKIMEKLNINQN